MTLAVALGPPVMVTIPPGPDVAGVLVGGAVVLVPVFMPVQRLPGGPFPQPVTGSLHACQTLG